MDLRCGCCGGELKRAAHKVPAIAPKNVKIIFTCVVCRSGYDTSASRTFSCEDFISVDGVTAADKEIVYENQKRFGQWKIRLSGHVSEMPGKHRVSTHFLPENARSIIGRSNQELAASGIVIETKGLSGHKEINNHNIRG